MRCRLITSSFLAALLLAAQPAAAFTKQEYRTAVVGVGYSWCLYKSGLMSKAKAQQVGNRYLVRKGLASGEVNAISKTSGFRAHVRQWISRKGGCNRLAKVFMAAVKRRAQQQRRGPGVPSLREGLSDTPFVW